MFTMGCDPCLLYKCMYDVMRSMFLQTIKFATSDLNHHEKGQLDKKKKRDEKR